MIMYAKIIDEETKLCQVGEGTNVEFYKSVGMSEMEVERAYNGGWYVAGYAPEKPVPTKEEQSEKRAEAYRNEVDPITSHIQRLRDEEPGSPEIDELLAERSVKVAEIKERYPYPTEEQ